MNRWLFVLLFALFSVDSFSEESPTVVTIATGTLPPHSSPQSAHLGYINHVISHAFSAVNIDAQFVFMPWARAYKETQKGGYMATSYWYRNAKHQEWFYQADKLIADRMVFFRKKSSQIISKIEDIKSLRLRLGLTRGYTYTDELWQWAEQNSRLVSVVNTDEQNMQMLVLGRIDVFPADEIAGWYVLNKNFSYEQVQTIETLGQGLISREATLLFSKTYPNAKHMLAKFNKGLAIISQQGILDDLQVKFVSGYYSEKSPSEKPSSE